MPEVFNWEIISNEFKLEMHREVCVMTVIIDLPRIIFNKYASIAQQQHKE